MPAEDLSLYFNVEGFGDTATLAGAPVVGILDVQGVEVFGGEAITTEPSFLLPTAAAAAAVSGASLVCRSVNYVVRTVTPEPPDGAIVRISLCRA